jgi:hypothetical protein
MKRQDGTPEDQRISNSARKTLLDPVQRRAEVGAGAGEFGIDAVAVTALEQKLHYLSCTTFRDQLEKLLSLAVDRGHHWG